MSTGVTVPTERRVRDDCKNQFPRNATEILARYEASNVKHQMQLEYDYPTTKAAEENTEAFRRAIDDEKDPSWITRNSPATAGFATQLTAAVIRQTQILWGDKTVLILKQASNIIQALTSGSLFYAAPETSTGLFIRSGGIFVSLLFNALLSLSEVTDSFTGRPVLAKHKSFALHHPAAWCLSQIITDIPIMLFQVSAFSLIVYFMVGLTTDAGAFFVFWFTILSSTAAMTALFRAVAAAFKTFDDASKISGLLVSALILYNGYMIPKSEMHPWFVW